MDNLTEKEKDAIWAMASCDMLVTEVSRALKVHRNTIVYRLMRIKEKTGLDPCRFYDLVELLDRTSKKEAHDGD